MALRWEQRIPVKRAPSQSREHVIRTIQRPGRIHVCCAGSERRPQRGSRRTGRSAAWPRGHSGWRCPSRAGWRMARRAVFATADAVAVAGITSPYWPLLARRRLRGLRPSPTNPPPAPPSPKSRQNEHPRDNLNPKTAPAPAGGVLPCHQRSPPTTPARWGRTTGNTPASVAGEG
jgi:hypothetical protein